MRVSSARKRGRSVPYRFIVSSVKIESLDYEQGILLVVCSVRSSNGTLGVMDALEPNSDMDRG